MAELSKVEELAAANLKDVPRDPCVIWDQAVDAKMAQDACSRSAAVDRLLSTREGSDLWRVCAAWDARQRKVLPDGTKSGNWGNDRVGGGVRRVPRAP